MANPQKQKGDRREREAVALCVRTLPDLVLPTASRELGAGRKNDTGDLAVFPDVCVQVKGRDDIARALAIAVDAAVRQQANRGVDLHLGLVPIPHARAGARWLAVTRSWPVEIDADALPTAGIPSRVIAAIRDKDSIVPLDARVHRILNTRVEPMIVASWEAWAVAYRQRRTQSLVCSA